METNIKPIYILYAEDDEDDRMFFSEAVKNSGLNALLTVLNDGDKLIKYLYNNLPDIIFPDINMPLRDGVSCLEYIRGCSRFHEVPVIILSTSDFKMKELLSAGANLFLCKTFFYKDPVNNLLKLFAPGWQKSLLQNHAKFV